MARVSYLEMYIRLCKQQITGKISWYKESLFFIISSIIKTILKRACILCLDHTAKINYNILIPIWGFVD